MLTQRRVRCGGIVTERLPVSDFGPLTCRPELLCTNSARDPDHAVLDVNIAPTKLGPLEPPASWLVAQRGRSELANRFGGREPASGVGKLLARLLDHVGELRLA